MAIEADHGDARAAALLLAELDEKHPELEAVVAGAKKHAEEEDHEEAVSPMIRALAYLIASVLVIGIVRSIIGIIMKGFADLFRPPASTRAAPVAPSIPAHGELKKDPVCGTFISTGSLIQKKVGGETYYFCSAECRDKFRG